MFNSFVQKQVYFPIYDQLRTSLWNGILDAVERPRPFTCVGKVLISAIPYVLKSGSMNPPGLSVDVSSTSISRKSSLATGSLPLRVLGLYQLVMMYN